MSNKPIDWTKPVENTKREPYRVLCTDGPNERYPVIAVNLNTKGVSVFSLTGWPPVQPDEIPVDLRNVPEPPREYTAWIYKNRLGALKVSFFEFEDIIDWPLFAKIKFKEGDGL